MQYFIADKNNPDYLLKELNKNEFDNLKCYHSAF